MQFQYHEHQDVFGDGSIQRHADAGAAKVNRPKRKDWLIEGCGRVVKLVHSLQPLFVKVTEPRFGREMAQPDVGVYSGLRAWPEKGKIVVGMQVNQFSIGKAIKGCGGFQSHAVTFRNQFQVVLLTEKGFSGLPGLEEGQLKATVIVAYHSRGNGFNTMRELVCSSEPEKNFLSWGKVSGIHCGSLPPENIGGSRLARVSTEIIKLSKNIPQFWPRFTGSAFAAIRFREIFLYAGFFP